MVFLKSLQNCLESEWWNLRLGMYLKSKSAVCIPSVSVTKMWVVHTEIYTSPLEHNRFCSELSSCSVSTFPNIHLYKDIVMWLVHANKMWAKWCVLLWNLGFFFFKENGVPSSLSPSTWWTLMDGGVTRNTWCYHQAIAPSMDSWLK